MCDRRVYLCHLSMIPLPPSFAKVMAAPSAHA